MKNLKYRWKKYGVSRNKTTGDTWFAYYQMKTPTRPFVEEFKLFKDRNERDRFVTDQNRMIKLYGDEQYYNLYRTLMK